MPFLEIQINLRKNSKYKKVEIRRKDTFGEKPDTFEEPASGKILGSTRKPQRKGAARAKTGDVQSIHCLI
jgi:hypothetical protein